MSQNPERYNEEQALEEAAKMHELVVSGETSSYSEAEQTLEDREKISRLLQRIKQRQPKRYHDTIEDADRRMQLGTNFTNELLRAVNGHTWASYREREHPEQVSKSRMGSQLGLDTNKIIPELADMLSRKLKGEVIIDLGSGPDATGYALADSLHARGYVGVEMNFANFANERIKGFHGETPFVVAQEDIGNFVSDLIKNNDKVKGIILSGIDQYSYTGRISLDQIIQDVYSVLENDGVLMLGGNLGYIKEDQGKTLDRYFEQIDVGAPSSFWILQKRKS